MLEVQVANDNALHWKKNLEMALQRGDIYREKARELRSILRGVQLLLGSSAIDYLTPNTKRNAVALLKLLDKELG